ncbi:hypothetical protein CBF45_13680 [Bordetella sp. J329]|nr:hypothetical protein CBF45_13680 [Bordetella sp. J329]
MNVTPTSIHPLASDAALRRRLLALARRWVGHGADAEDLVQEAYLRTAQGGLPETEAGREAWLVTVLQRLCIDAWRRQGRYQAILARDPLIPMDEAPEPAAQADQARRVEQALALLIQTLSAGAVAAVLLYEVFGFGHAELGALSGRSEAASRQQMHRWLQRLRGRCAPSGGAAAVAMADEEEHSELFLLCSQALAQRDPFNLIAILRTAQPQMLGAAPQRCDSAGAAQALGLAASCAAGLSQGLVLARAYRVDTLLALLAGSLTGWAWQPAAQAYAGDAGEAEDIACLA